MSKDHIPASCPHYCSIKEIKLKDKSLCICTDCGVWEQSDERAISNE